MSRVLDILVGQLEEHAPAATQFSVALSGGLDSSVLLHALRGLCTERPRLVVRALHVNHHLHPQSDDWQQRCLRLCETLGVPLISRDVRIEEVSGHGLEAAARRARYAVFREACRTGEFLLTAHHQDDQLETVLLRLVRGAGTRGLAGIPRRQRFAAGWLLRPLLDVTRRELEAYARAAGLDWVEDPANVDAALDRNYLRHQVVPLLRDRWPAVGETVGRAARLSAEAARLLDDLAARDAAEVGDSGLIGLAALRNLPAPRQRNLVRYLVVARGLLPPSEAQLRVGLAQLLSARGDRQPVLRWPQGQIRRYRERLHILDFDPDEETKRLPGEYAWDARTELSMGPVRGRLRRLPADVGGIAEAQLAGELKVRFRVGGERLRVAGHARHHALKKLFQARGVVPWMRGHVPVLWSDDQLLAVGDLWVSADSLARPGELGFAIGWDQHAPIH